MKIKIYNDKTYNIFYESGDHIKIKHDKRFGDVEDKEVIWGKVIKVVGKPLTAKLIIETDKGTTVEEYVWNVVPVTEDGIEITKDQLFKIVPVTESIYHVIDNNDRTIIKFNDFN